MPSPSTALLADFDAALRPHLRGDLRTDAMTRALYATDASLYQMMPLAVLFPQHEDDVQAALEEAQRYNIPVLPRGGGSSLAGQTVNAALVVDFSRHLNALVELNTEERWVRVQPGLVLERLSAALRPHGLLFGPDPASGNRATLGGMMGNNSTGTHSILYGNVIHHVRSAKALLADGTAVRLDTMDPSGWAARARKGDPEGSLYREVGALIDASRPIIERDTPRHWRRNSGYRLEHLLEEKRNLAHLLCGSEGTLAVTTELTLGLVERPLQTALGVVHYRTRREALRSVTTILETKPSAVELFDGIAIDQTRQAPGYAARLEAFVTGAPGAVLITEYYGASEAELTDRLDQLEARLRLASEGYAVVRLRQPEAIQEVWSVRNEGLGLIMSVKGDHKPVAFIEDASVPAEHLADYIDGLQALLDETETQAAMYAHASAGCLHVRPFINTKDAAEVAKMEALAAGSMELVRQFGGAVSSEHGDGRARSWLNEPLLGTELYEVNRRVKALFDPKNLLNPGNVVDPPPMTEHLRMGPDYMTMPVLEQLDFSEDGGFARSVELCNGNGACRKLHGGTMCPSFMVTLEEEHSTRGRANALRAALSGTLPQEAFASDRMYEVMDLCIQCKACKTECPSKVDMAKLKIEWLSKYWEAHRMPLRTRLFAYMPRLARRLPTPFAPSTNWFNRRDVVRKMLGISPQRSLPTFARKPFTAWFRKQNWTVDGPDVLLFADTFNNFNHPEAARAAAEFLHRTGHRVRVPDDRACCGRPLLSKGLLGEARKQALDTVERLYPYAEEGLPIVGLEPSCLLTFRDEFLSLLPGDPRARRVADVALTFEEFVAQRAAAGAFEGVRWKTGGRRVLVHGHCYQKALVGLLPSVQCLSLPGYTVEAIDSGCCGMAGAFGYEAEHYDISIQMAERVLAPAVRAADEDTLIAAAGTSCRAQIHDTTGRHALHPAEILRDALA